MVDTETGQTAAPLDRRLTDKQAAFQAIERARNLIGVLESAGEPTETLIPRLEKAVSAFDAKQFLEAEMNALETGILAQLFLETSGERLAADARAAGGLSEPHPRGASDAGAIRPAGVVRPAGTARPAGADAGPPESALAEEIKRLRAAIPEQVAAAVRGLAQDEAFLRAVESRLVDPLLKQMQEVSTEEVFTVLNDKIDRRTEDMRARLEQTVREAAASLAAAGGGPVTVDDVAARLVPAVKAEIDDIRAWTRSLVSDSIQDLVDRRTLTA
jgi:hypothetical protein